MKTIRQEDRLGCAVACVAFVLQISYKNALQLFKDGEHRVVEKPNFYCPEIVKILNSHGKNYAWKKIKSSEENDLGELSIVFISRSERYKYGHFLCKHRSKWMDSWINLPDKNIKAGWRVDLPGIPSYVIYMRV